MQTPDRFETTPKVKQRRLNVLPSHSEEMDTNRVVSPGRFPSWLHRKLPTGLELQETAAVIDDNRLYTVCEEAKCPNRLECWSKKAATFLVMGKACTRSCGFCSIDFSKAPKELEEDEPQRVADSAKKLGLRHIVITMVARDDLPDGGAQHLVKIIGKVRSEISGATIEVLTSDFNGNLEAVRLILEAQPEIFNHNIETVRALTPRVRHTATYDRTLTVLEYAKMHRTNSNMLVKSGIMVGLGETKDQVHETLRDLAAIGCDIITIGQYLQSDPRKLLVKSFITPEQFKEYEDYGYTLGIKRMYCGPFVRSSYNADVIMSL